MRISLQSASILLLLLLVACQSEGKYKRQLETDHFVYFSEDGKRSDVVALQNDLGAGYDRISRLLNVQINGKLNVIMYSSQADYVKETKLPVWSSGGYAKKGLLLSSAKPAVAVHELTHVMINQINPNTPRWLNEGIASYLGEDIGGWDVTASIMAIADKVPPYSSYSIEDPTRFMEMNGYALSTSMIDYISKTYGWRYVPDLIRSPYDFEGIFGMSGEAFWESWKQYLRQA